MEGTGTRTRGSWTALTAVFLLATAVGCRVEDWPTSTGPTTWYSPRCSQPAWSPDGTRIAFRGIRFTGQHYVDGIYVADVEGDAAEFLAFGWHPDWSPDGRSLAFTRYGAIIVVLDLITMTERDVPGTDVGDGGSWFPAWSPDGKSIAFSCVSTSDTAGIWIAHLEDPPAVSQLPTGDLRGSDPSWSPDGMQIAFSGSTRDGEHVWVFKFRTNELQQITNNVAFSMFSRHPAWSPSGKYLAYTTARYGVHVIDLGSGRDRTLEDTGHAEMLDWSPDEERIIYVREHYGSPDQSLWVIDDRDNKPLNIAGFEWSGGVQR